MIQPLRDLILIRILEQDERAGSIYLPEVSREDATHDGLCVAVGPECSQVAIGDRCVHLRYTIRSYVEPQPPQVQVDSTSFIDYVYLSTWGRERGMDVPEDVWEHEEAETALLRAWSRARFALVAESDLVAVISGPEHAELKAANDYVLIEPDRHKQYEERPSGVVVAGHSLPGFTGRNLKRGKELLDQAAELVRSPRFREATPYDQWRIRQDWQDALSSTDRAAWLDACRDNGEAGGAAWAWTPFVAKESPVTGRLVSIGPGPYREPGTWLGGKHGRRSHGIFSDDEHGGVPIHSDISCLAVGPEMPRVSWSKEHRGAELFSGGRALIALRAADLDAFFVDSVVVEEFSVTDGMRQWETAA